MKKFEASGKEVDKEADGAADAVKILEKEGKKDHKNFVLRQKEKMKRREEIYKKVINQIYHFNMVTVEDSTEHSGISNLITKWFLVELFRN
nr:14897_t:CDS:2 [Entrophospora candida]